MLILVFVSVFRARVEADRGGLLLLPRVQVTQRVRVLLKQSAVVHLLILNLLVLFSFLLNELLLGLLLRLLLNLLLCTGAPFAGLFLLCLVLAILARRLLRVLHLANASHRQRIFVFVEELCHLGCHRLLLRCRSTTGTLELSRRSDRGFRGLRDPTLHWRCPSVGLVLDLNLEVVGNVDELVHLSVGLFLLILLEGGGGRSAFFIRSSER